MECNKDEAARSKEIAEAKFLQHDYVGARKFALKARQLFPELEGLPQFISVLEIHSVAQEKLQGGERNWYGILQVDPMADESTIRKQYRKLALLLHPDKNKSVGAEAAFKHISEAWGVLSDKTRKAAHDMKRNAKVSQSSKVAQFKEPSSTSNGYHRPQPQPQPKPHQPSAPPPPPPPKLGTFWTACPSCRMQFEFLRIYENKNLCCPVCYKPFQAREVPAVSGATLWPSQKQQGFRMEAEAPDYHANGIKTTSFGNDTSQWPPFGNMDAARVVHPQTSESAKKENADSQAWKDLGKQAQKNADFKVWKDLGKKEQKQKGHKKESDEDKAKAAAQAKQAFDRLIARSKGVIQQKLSSDKAAALEGKIAADNTSIKVPNLNNGCGEGKENRVSQDKEDPDGISSASTYRSMWGKRTTPTRCDNQEDSSPGKKQRTYAQVSLDEQVLNGGLCKKTDDFSSGTGNMENIDRNGGHDMAKGTAIPKAPVDMGENANVSAARGSSLQQNLSLPVTSRKSINTLHTGSMHIVTNHINVPDAEFYDFDKDRTEHHFCIGQIWAAYDDNGGMPRYYARINKVISYQPFKVQMSWLEARFPSDETMNGFSYTCGEYKLGNTTINECINTFSHLVTYEKGPRGGFRIYPKKGDIWALYKDSNTLQMKYERPGYDMIEVLTDFKDEVGVQVCLLVKIEGFKALFQRQLEAQCLQWISPKELQKFSHQVPAHSLIVERAPGLQEGCWELDPASTPLDLITGRQVE